MYRYNIALISGGSIQVDLTDSERRALTSQHKDYKTQGTVNTDKRVWTNGTVEIDLRHLSAIGRA